MAAQAAQQVNPEQLNMAQRVAVLKNAVKMTQPILSTSIDPTKTNQVTVTPQNVGLICGFLVQITGTLTNGAGSTANRTEFGVYNLLQQVVFTDLNSVTRIQTAGWHLGFLNSARQGYVFGGAYAPNMPVNYGNNWTVQTAPATIAASTDAAVSVMFYVPISYSQTDLRGAIYAAVTNGTMNMQLTLNTSPFQATGDATLQVYSGNAGAWKTGTNISVVVSQVYYDQIPKIQNDKGAYVPILPFMDTNTVYNLKNASGTGVIVNQDYPFNFPNYQDFLSCMAVYDNAGTLNAGSDVSYWSLVSANQTNIFRYNAPTAALLARQTFMSDPAKGLYYFDFRDNPIRTDQFGNMQLMLNASSVTTGASVMYGLESFTYPTVSNQGQGLSAG